jgi:hypothetical protein
VTPSKLVTHRFDFADALKAYDLLDDKSSEYYLGIVLKYAQAQGSEKAFKAAPKPERVVQRNSSCGGADSACCSGSAVGVGFVGAGNFAKAVLLPALKKTAGIDCVGVCTATGVSAHAAAANSLCQRQHGHCALFCLWLKGYGKGIFRALCPQYGHEND